MNGRVAIEWQVQCRGAVLMMSVHWIALKTASVIPMHMTYTLPDGGVLDWCLLLERSCCLLLECSCLLLVRSSGLGAAFLPTAAGAEPGAAGDFVEAAVGVFTLPAGGVAAERSKSSTCREAGLLVMEPMRLRLWMPRDLQCIFHTQLPSAL